MTGTQRVCGVGMLSTLLLILMFLAGGAPKTDAASGDTVHIRGVVYSFFGIDEHAPGAVIRVDEFPGISAPVALDGSYDIEVPDNSNVTLYAETPETYVETYLQTFRTSGEDIEKAHFQLPRDWHYNAFSALLEIPRDKNGVAEDCVIVSTFSIHEARDATEFDPGFKDVYPHGLPGATATMTPRSPGAKGPIFFDNPPIIIPNVELTESTVDGGVLFTEVTPGYHWMEASHATEEIAPFMAHCENGRIINASPPWGFYEVKPGEQPDPAVFAIEPDVSVDATVAKRAVAKRKGKRRLVVVRVVAGEKLTAKLKVTRGKSVIAKSGLRTIKEGKRSLLSVVRRTVGPGPARATVVLRDGAGNVKTVSRKVRIPR